MAFQIMPVEFLGGSPLDTIGVRIKRFDGLVFDNADQTFKAESSCIQPFLGLTIGTGDEATLLSASYTINPAQWTDGDYRCYFHNTSLLVSTPTGPQGPQGSSLSVPIISECVFQVWAGNTRYFNPTDVAARILDGTIASHKVVGSVGAWMTAVNAKLDWLCAQIGEEGNVTPPKPGF